MTVSPQDNARARMEQIRERRYRSVPRPARVIAIASRSRRTPSWS